MTATDTTTDETTGMTIDWRRAVPSHRILAVGMLAIVTSDPVAAQSTGKAFCETALASTIKNIFTLIQFGGPLLGGVIAIGGTAIIPVIRQADQKRELRQVRNQGILWGVIVTPLGTTIVQFLLNYVVAGGVSCSF